MQKQISHLVQQKGESANTLPTSLEDLTHVTSRKQVDPQWNPFNQPQGGSNTVITSKGFPNQQGGQPQPGSTTVITTTNVVNQQAGQHNISQPQPQPQPGSTTTVTTTKNVVNPQAPAPSNPQQPATTTVVTTKGTTNPQTVETITTTNVIHDGRAPSPGKPAEGIAKPGANNPWNGFYKPPGADNPWNGFYKPPGSTSNVVVHQAGGSNVYVQDPSHQAGTTTTTVTK